VWLLRRRRKTDGAKATAKRWSAGAFAAAVSVLHNAHCANLGVDSSAHQLRKTSVRNTHDGKFGWFCANAFIYLVFLDEEYAKNDSHLRKTYRENSME
jgi:hypothetical protein